MSILFSTIVTVFIARVIGFFAIYYFPSIYFDNFYHLYYGLVLLVFVFVYRRFSEKTQLILLGIALGLIVDDIAVVGNFFTGPGADPIATYWSGIYIIPLFLGLILIAFFEDKLKQFFIR